MNPRRRAIVAAAALAALTIGAYSAAMAQSYPSRNIRILVGFAPGGAMDIAQ